MKILIIQHIEELKIKTEIELQQVLEFSPKSNVRWVLEGKIEAFEKMIKDLEEGNFSL